MMNNIHIVSVYEASIILKHIKYYPLFFPWTAAPHGILVNVTSPKERFQVIFLTGISCDIYQDPIKSHETLFSVRNVTQSRYYGCT